MGQARPALPVQVGVVVEGVHLVHGDVGQPIGVFAQRGDQRHGLAVGEGDDDVGARRDEVDDVRGSVQLSDHPTMVPARGPAVERDVERVIADRSG